MSAPSATGAVYVMSNQATGNSVTVFDRAADGGLTQKGTFPTGGLGAGSVTNPLDSLTSQGSLVISEDHSCSRWKPAATRSPFWPSRRTN